MNKFAIILPLIILSAFLGYFGSSLLEQVYAILAVTTVGVALGGILLFFDHQKAGDRRRTRKRY